MLLAGALVATVPRWWRSRSRSGASLQHAGRVGSGADRLVAMALVAGPVRLRAVARRRRSRSVPALRRRRGAGGYRELADKYPGQTGGCAVEVPDREGHLAKLATSFRRPAARRVPDQLPQLGRVRRARRDRPGRPAARLGAFAREDFFPLPLQAFKFDGTLHCVPQNASSLAVYYNLDAFREAGVPRPGELDLRGVRGRGAS